MVIRGSHVRPLSENQHKGERERRTCMRCGASFPVYKEDDPRRRVCKSCASDKFYLKRTGLIG